MATFEEFRIERSYSPYRLAMMCSVLVFLVFFTIHPAGPADVRQAALESASTSLISSWSKYGVDVRKTISDRLIDAGSPTGVYDLAEPLPVFFQAVQQMLLGPGAPRLVFAIAMALFSLLMFVLAMQLLSRLWLAIFVQLLASFNPLLFQWPYFNPDLLAMLLLTAALVLLLDKGNHPFLLGLLFAAISAFRVEGLLLLPLWVAKTWFTGHEGLTRRVMDQVKFILVGAASLILFGWLNLALYGVPCSDPLFIAHLQTGADLHKHSIAGLVFLWPYPLAFPFSPEFMRTPCTPFPTLLMYPMLLLASIGLVGAGLLLMGASQLLFEARAKALLVLAFLVTSWVFHNSKADLRGSEAARLLLIYPAVWIFISAGLARFTRIGPLRNNVVKLALLLLFLALSVRISYHLSFDVDDRAGGLDACGRSPVVCKVDDPGCTGLKRTLTKTSLWPRSIVPVAFRPDLAWEDFLRDSRPAPERKKGTYR